MFFLIRTLKSSGTQILISDSRAVDCDGEPVRTYAFASRADAEAYAAAIRGCKVYEFRNVSEARMYLDPACVTFRTQYDSQVAT